MSILRQPLARYVALASTVSLVFVHYLNMQAEYDAARLYFVRSAITDAERVSKKVDAAFHSIHRAMSSVANSSTVMALGQRTPAADVSRTVQEMRAFDDLVRDSKISKLLIAPMEAMDTSAGGGKQPLVTLVRDGVQNPAPRINVDGTMRRSDYAEMQQVRLHQKWFRDNPTTVGSRAGSVLAMLGSPAVPTSDTRVSVATGRAKDHDGHVFSVPYFSREGALRGTVSIVVLSGALRKLLPAKNYALVNTRYNHVSQSLAGGQEKKSVRWVEIGAPDPNLAASNVIDLKSFDPRSKWQLWSGRPNSAFYDSSAYQTIALFETGGYVGLVMLLILLLFIQWLEVARNKAKRATEIAEKTRLAHEKTIAAEREARRLNEELRANMQMLSDTQLELVKHERLAALGQVTATLSHEIRNPLGAIRSSLYVIRQAALKAELKLDRPIDRIERSVSRCDNLIGDFLEYTRTNDLSFQVVDSTEFLNLLLDDQKFADGIKIIRDFPSAGPQISIDPDRFRSVVINLVENAAQAIAEHRDDGGEIRVSCAADETGTRIIVADNGPGIPDDVLEKIFEPLFTTKSFGAGLGLATVNQLVEQHGAEMTIDTNVGIGTTFTVQLKPPVTTVANKNTPTFEEKAA